MVDIHIASIDIALSFCFLSLGIDHLLSQHIAHLFVRDTLTLFEEKLNLDDTQDTDHFEVFIGIRREKESIRSPVLEYQFN